MKPLHCLLPLVALTSMLHAQEISYEPLYTPSTFDAHSIDLSRPVGSTLGEGGATLSGAATYQIPIVLPPGTNQVVPSLSLSYNSRSGYSNVGWGWSLSAYSVISRVPANYYYDNVVQPVQLSTDDRFALDGQRLLLVSGLYGEDGSTYGFEVENFSTVTLHGQGSQSWMELVTREGIVMEYGRTPDSRFLDESGNTPLSWALNRVIHPDGNYIDYVYTHTDREEPRLSKILYTGNHLAGMAPYNEVSFEYKVRQDGTFSDIRTLYLAGSQVVSRYLLDRIVVRAENELVRSYQLTYGNDGINSYLIRVTERNGSGESLNPTIFKYGNQPLTRALFTTSIPSGSDIHNFSGDFNGDGLYDIISATVTETQQGISFYSDFKVYLKSKTTNGYDLAVTKTLPTNYSVYNKIPIPNQYGLIAGDFTGDGNDDVLSLNISFAGTEAQLNSVKIFASQNGGTSFQETTWTIHTGYKRIHPSNKFFYPGDFDGDGMSEYICLLGTYPNEYGVFIQEDYRSTGGLQPVTISGPTMFPIANWVNVQQINLLDFNGDGKTDIMLTGISGTEIFTLNGTVATRIYAGSFPSADEYIQFGDFNGDGKTDLVAYNADFTSVIKGVSTGKVFVQSPLGITDHLPAGVDPPSPSFYRNILQVGDFNGDGKTDLYYEWNRARTTQLPDGYQVQQFVGNDIFYSTGDGFHYEQIYYFDPIMPPVHTMSVAESPSFGLTPLDYNGDGNTDLVFGGNSTLGVWIFHGGGREKLLEKVSDGFGKVTEYTYRSLINSGDFYVKGTFSPPFPVNVIQPAGIMVEEVRTDNGIGGYFAKKYNYEGFLYHRTGKGSLGFMKVSITDLSLNQKTITESELNSTYFTLLPKKTSTYLASDQTLLSESITTQNWVKSIDAKRYLIKPSAIDETDALAGVTTTTELQYDNFGNVTRQSVNIPGVQTSVTDYEYEAVVTGIPTLISLTTNSITRNGESTHQTQTKYNYNQIGQLITKIDFYQLPKAVTTHYQYNSLGNRVEQTTSASGIPARTISSVFDSKGRYPLTTTNELSQQSSQTFSPKWGTPVSSTGVDGLTTLFQYDDWGNLTQTHTPDGVTVTISRTWDINGTQAYYQETLTTGKPAEKTWFDRLGRKIRTETEGFDGQWSRVTTAYDQRGNLYSISDPHFPHENPSLTTRIYDALNRMQSVTHTDLGTSTYDYQYNAGNLTVTTSTPKGTQFITTDATGAITRAGDASGTLHYSYFSHGGVRAVSFQPSSGPARELMSATYDEYGRQTSLTDIDAGTTYYEYDALGQLVWQMTANGDETSLTYNPLGQVTSRSMREGIVTYVYGSSNTNGEFRNRIKTVNGFAGTSTTYLYDDRGLLSQRIENNGGQHTTSYTYTPDGHLQKVVYPSGVEIRYEYNPRGYLESIRQGAELIYRTLSTNARGQVTHFQRGSLPSGSNITYQNGFPTAYTTSGIQDYQLSWDFPRGLLISRKDNRPSVNKVENFTYDNLQRLTGAQLAGQPSTILSYLPDGNIIHKSDVGSYAYDLTKVHAVTEITNPVIASFSILKQEIDYTSFMQPESIKDSGPEGSYTLTYTYGANLNRVKSELKIDNSIVAQRYYYEAGFEKNITAGSEQYLHYVESPAGLIALIVSQNGSHHTYFTFTDHLGSILTVTNTSGTVIAEQNFDAWGRRRDAGTWTANHPTTSPGLPDWLYRGYTGHEHVDALGLINMNGRMYDPVLGRMLSADNQVPDIYHPQDYNRYTYARNNPLVYTDPDGEFWHLVIGGAIGGIVNLGVEYVQGNIHNSRDFFRVMGQGFLKGFMTSLGCPGCSFETLLASTAVSVGNSYLPSYSVSLGDFVLTIGPSVSFGTTGIMLGGNVGLYYNSPYFIPGINFGLGYFIFDQVTETKGWSKYIGGGAVVGDENVKFGIFSNKFSGRGLNQRTGTFLLNLYGHELMYENDFMFGVPIADNGDKFRSAGIRYSHGDLTFGVNIFTGDPDAKISGSPNPRPFVTTDGKDIYKTDYGSSPDKFRLGAFYGGKGGYRFGWTSETIRHIIQNRIAHDFLTGGKAKWFRVLDGKSMPYINFQTVHKYTTWTF